MKRKLKGFCAFKQRWVVTPQGTGPPPRGTRRINAVCFTTEAAAQMAVRTGDKTISKAEWKKGFRYSYDFFK